MKKNCISSDLVIKSSKPNNTIISGYASVFGVIDSQNDVVTKGAFASALSEKVKLLWQHDASKPIGVIKSLQEDEYGLRFEAEINNKVEVGREASELIKQKAVGGLSIGFSINSSHYDENGVHIIEDIDLSEISVVTFPANNQAEINYVKNQTSGDDISDLALEELSDLVKKLKEY